MPSGKPSQGPPAGDGNCAGVPSGQQEAPVRSTSIPGGPSDSSLRLLLTELPWDWALPVGNRKAKFRLRVVLLHFVLTDAVTDDPYRQLVLNCTLGVHSAPRYPDQLLKGTERPTRIASLLIPWVLLSVLSSLNQKAVWYVDLQEMKLCSSLYIRKIRVIQFVPIVLTWEMEHSANTSYQL